MERELLISRLPITGMPRDDPEASLAIAKYQKALEGLARIYPKIQNAEANVKVRARSGEGRRRYEVKVALDLPHHRHEFIEEDWSLANAFDRISDKMKRLGTKPEKKQSYKNRVTRGEFQEESL